VKWVHELHDELDKQWPGNEVRVLDERGIQYSIELVEEEDEVTYLKVAELDVPSV
jgi:hypothetical protein